MKKIKNLIFGTGIILMISSTGCNLNKKEVESNNIVYTEYETTKEENNEYIEVKNIPPFNNTAPSTISLDTTSTSTLPSYDEISCQDERKLVALTFDDGPSKFTKELIDVLNKYNIKATFFVIENNCKNYPDALSIITDNGHELAIHGSTHTSFTKLKINEVNNEIVSTINYIESLNLEVSKIVRPPYGSLNDDLKENIEYPFVLWNIDTEDWKTKNKEKIKSEILDNIQEGSIILMHDTKVVHNVDITVLEEILPDLILEYNFVTISELAEQFNTKLENGKAYRKIKSEK